MRNEQEQDKDKDKDKEKEKEKDGYTSLVGTEGVPPPDRLDSD